MRHQKHRRTLGVTKEHRAALLANLASSLIKHGRIRTTTAKAKALRPFVERIVTLAKTGDIHRRRVALSRLRDESAVKKLFNERAGDFANRAGGYTRIYKLAEARLGDAADMSIIEFVGAGDQGYKKAGRRKSRTKAKAKKAAPAETTAATASEGEAGATPAAETPKAE
jgi:large subunit ribosomal protein L17